MTRLTPLLFLLPILLAMQASQPATHEAVKAYRDYVHAIRQGDLAAVLERVEPVPATSRPALEATMEAKIAVEAVTTEMIKRLGPPKEDEEGWNMGQLTDAMLETLRVADEQQDAALLVMKDPFGGEGSAGIMVRRDGAWKVAAGPLIGVGDPTPTFVEPPAEELAQTIRFANAITTAAVTVLERLKKGEFNDAASVQSALGEEMQRAFPNR